jgi:Pre-mRNA splicing Prp18-interacting factor.
MSTSQPTHQTETVSDRQKARQEAEARASGQLPPEVDVKTGSMINPHNPEFITKRPWYLGGNDEGPSLDHQASQKADSERLELSLQRADELVEIERRKLKEARKRNKFRVGMWVEALKKNRKPYMICQIIKISKKGTVFDVRYEDGTMEKNIKMSKSERFSNAPRIRMTKTGNRAFEVNHALHGKETYDSKRDKYHGFEVQLHQKRLQEIHAERETIRRMIKASKQKEAGTNPDENERASDSDSDYDSDEGSDSDDEFVQKDADAKVITSRLARQGGVGGAQMKVTARNLRIREDTAKYLRNLNPNSAYYDPKSRSMRDNPNPEADPSEVQFAGDNFARVSGDAIGLAQTQVFAWDVMAKTGAGNNGEAAAATVHPQANPSQTELLKKKFTTQALDLKMKQKKAVLDKYGGAEYLDGGGGLGSAINSASNDNAVLTDNERIAQERKARFGVTLQEEHFSRDGKSLKHGLHGSKQRMNLKSKYEENIFINGHNTVWGSYFHKGAFRWGYADDHSLMRNSYCTGENGRIANDEANEMKYGTGLAGSAALAQAREMLKAIPQNQRSQTFAKKPTDSSLYGEADQFAEFDKQKIKEAILKEEKRGEKALDDRKRKYNSTNADVDVTEEEMEAYRLRKERRDDPMSNLDADEILNYN